MDALSEVLQAVKLTGGVFLDCRFSAPWRVFSKIGPEEIRPFLVDLVQVIGYHYVIKGRMLVEVEGDDVIEVRAGQAVLLPRCDPHKLGSSTTMEPVQADSLIQMGESGKLARLVLGGGGEPTHIVCGYLGSDQRRNPLIETLPRLLRVDLSESEAGAWLESSLRFAVHELEEGNVGTSTVMSKLSELMFIQAVRAYAATLPVDQKSWLAGMRDPSIGRALALLHGKLNHNWTTEALAREVALSRSAFNERFTALIGMPPKRYLTFWRLQVARERLREGQQSIAQIAYEVGYEAEEAFNRAFKREFGMPPATWRKHAHRPASPRDEAARFADAES